LSWRACREFCKIKCEKIWWVRKKVVPLQMDWRACYALHTVPKATNYL